MRSPMSAPCPAGERQAGRIVFAAALQRLQGGDDLVRAVVLEDHRIHAGVVQRRHDHGVGHHGQHHHADAGVVADQVLDQADAVAVEVVAGHGVVGDDHLRRVACKLFDQRRGRVERGDDLEAQVLFQQVGHGHQDQRMVVGDGDTESLHAKRGQVGRGDRRIIPHRRPVAERMAPKPDEARGFQD